MLYVILYYGIFFYIMLHYTFCVILYGMTCSEMSVYIHAGGNMYVYMLVCTLLCHSTLYFAVRSVLYYMLLYCASYIRFMYIHIYT